MEKTKAYKIWEDHHGSKTEAIDAFGKTIKKSDYGKKNVTGWEVDRIYPLSKKVSKTRTSLQPLQHKNNQQKADKLQGKVNGKKFKVTKKPNLSKNAKKGNMKESKYLNQIIFNDLYKSADLLKENPELKGLKFLIEEDIKNVSNKSNKKFINDYDLKQKKWFFPYNGTAFYNNIGVVNNNIKTFKKTYSIAYFSKWGTGKTSRLTQLFEEELQIKPVIINMWKFVNLKNKELQIQDFIINEIIGVLSKFDDVVGYNVNTKKFKGLSIKIKFLNFISRTAYIKDIPKSLTEKIWFLNQIIKKKLLKNMNKPIIIIFDDIDRVDSKFIPYLLDAIRNYIEIPGVISVVPIDDDKLINALKDKHKNDYQKFISKYFNYAIKATNMPIIDRETIFEKVWLKEIAEQDFDPNIIKNIKSIFTTNIKDLTYRSSKDIINRFIFNLIALNIKNNDVEKIYLMAYATLIQAKHPLLYKNICSADKAEETIRKILDSTFNFSNTPLSDEDLELQYVKNNYVRNPIFPKEQKNVNILFLRYITLSIGNSEKIKIWSEFNTEVSSAFESNDYTITKSIDDVKKYFKITKSEFASKKNAFYTNWLMNNYQSINKKDDKKWIIKNILVYFTLPYNKDTKNLYFSIASHLEINIEKLVEILGINQIIQDSLTINYPHYESFKNLYLENDLASPHFMTLSNTVKFKHDDDLKLKLENLDYSIILTDNFDIDKLFWASDEIKNKIREGYSWVIQDENSKNLIHKFDIKGLFLKENIENPEWIHNVWNILLTPFKNYKLFNKIIKENVHLDQVNVLSNNVKIEFMEYTIKNNIDFLNLWQYIDWSNDQEQKIKLQNQLIDKEKIIYHNSFLNQDIDLLKFNFSSMKQFINCIEAMEWDFPVKYFKLLNTNNNLKSQVQENLSNLFSITSKYNLIGELLKILDYNIKISNTLFEEYSLIEQVVKSENMSNDIKKIFNQLKGKVIKFKFPYENFLISISELESVVSEYTQKYDDMFDYTNTKVLDLKKYYKDKIITFPQLQKIYDDIIIYDNEINWNNRKLLKTQIREYKKDYND